MPLDLRARMGRARGKRRRRKSRVETGVGEGEGLRGCEVFLRVVSSLYQNTCIALRVPTPGILEKGE